MADSRDAFRCDPLTDPAHQALKEVFGYDAFRARQLDAIETALAGRDSVVLMPTGGGKSICYQIPPLINGGCTVVVSPLIALMQDQVTSLDQLGLAAASLNSAMSGAAQRDAIERLQAGTLKLIYLAPERLLQQDTLAMLKQCAISLIAIDEAHCVSQWGHDFRRDYLELHQLGEDFPGVPRMARPRPPTNAPARISPSGSRCGIRAGSSADSIGRTSVTPCAPAAMRASNWKSS